MPAPDPLFFQKILVLGLGVEGISTMKFFGKIGVKFAASDARPPADLAPDAREILEKTGVEFFPQKNLPEKIADFDLVVKTPGAAVEKIPGLKNARKITTAAQIFFDRWPGRVLAVTGSKGKSTAAVAAFRFLRAGGIPARLGGNIGALVPEAAPLLDFLDFEGGNFLAKTGGESAGEARGFAPRVAGVPPARAAQNRGEADPGEAGGVGRGAEPPSEFKPVAVCELSSFQLDGLDFAPDAAIFTSLFPEHLENHGGSFENYRAAKMRIFAGQKPGQTAFFPTGLFDPAEVLGSGKKIPVPAPGAEFFAGAGPTAALALPGAHQAQNIELAVRAAKFFAVPGEKIAGEIPRLAALPHRLQKIAEIGGRSFWDDSIATNPPATVAAIKSFPAGGVGSLLLGGSEKGGEDWDFLASKITRAGVPAVALFPTTGAKIRAALGRAGFAGAVREFEKMPAAVAWAAKNAPAGSAVVLSPASASFSLWRNYAERGEDFAAAVAEFGQAG